MDTEVREVKKVEKVKVVMPHRIKGSKEAKDYMAVLRSKKGVSKTKIVDKPSVL